MRINETLTITAGTPINVATALPSGNGLPVIASRVFMQLQPGATGIAYVMDGIYGVANGAPRVPSHTASSDLTAILYGAAATTPGSTYSDADYLAGIDVSKMWIDGSVSGDKVTVSYVLKN